MPPAVCLSAFWADSAISGTVFRTFHGAQMYSLTASRESKMFGIAKYRDFTNSEPST